MPKSKINLKGKLPSSNPNKYQPELDIFRTTMTNEPILTIKSLSRIHQKETTHNDNE